MHIKHDKIKKHSLTGRINNDLVLRAYKAVRRNRGAAGVDRVSIDAYGKNLDANLEVLKKSLKKRTFQAQPLRRVYIPKGNGQKRPLGIPTIRSRIAQEVVRRLIEPTFENRFHNNSFGFRPGRGCIEAIQKVRKYLKDGYRYIVDADIKGFFDNIPHALIMETVASRIADGNILGLIQKFLEAGVMEEGKRIHTTKGTPQGGVISPLLANAVLDHLDWYLEEQGYKFVRYADDFVILCKTQTDAEKALKASQEMLEDHMGLELNKEKTHIVKACDGFTFLGFTIRGPNNISIRDKSKKKFKDTIRELTTRKHNLDQKAVNRINVVIRGFVNYFGQPFNKLRDFMLRIDKWIRSRLRAMKKKRKWKTDNRRIQNKHLKKLGLLSGRDILNKRVRC